MRIAVLLAVAVGLMVTTIAVTAGRSHATVSPAAMPLSDLVANRIERAPALLEAARAFPEKTVFVTVSLRQPVRVASLEERLLGNPGRLSELWHIFVGKQNVFRGGYLLARRESVRGAVQSYQTTFAQQLSNQITDLRAQPEASTDAALARLISDLESRLVALRSGGAEIYGFALEGSAGTLIPFAQRFANDAVIEVSEGRLPLEPLTFGGTR